MNDIIRNITILIISLVIPATVVYEIINGNITATDGIEMLFCFVFIFSFFMR